MQPERDKLYLVRLQKAKSDFEASLILYKENMLLQALNRAYYAIFHSAKALLALDNFETNKHSGVIAYFNEHYVKTGIFDKELSKIFMSAENKRNLCYYDDFFAISKDDVKIQIDNAKKFINEIEGYLSKKGIILTDS